MFKQAIAAVLFLFSSLIAKGQDKLGSFEPGNLIMGDFSFAYHDKNRNHYTFIHQTGKDITRILLDSAFNVKRSRSFTSNDISYRSKNERKRFIEVISLESGLYEIFAEKDSLYILQPNFMDGSDSLVQQIGLRLTDKDERFLAVFPSSNKIFFLTAAFKRSKLILIIWDPAKEGLSFIEFELPDSNMDKSQYKEYPKETRITFHKHLFNPVVVPLNQAIFTSRPGPILYYSDSIVHILMQIPYFLGPFTITLDIRNGGIKTHNYLVNDLRTNAGTNNNKIKYPTACIVDSLLIIKNLSASTYEYLFYNIKDHRLIKKLEATESTIETVVSSRIRNKGSWLSGADESVTEKKKAYIKMGGGFILPSAIRSDSFTLTNITITPTKGIEGTLLDIVLPSPLDFAGIFATDILPFLVPKRNNISYFHSRFSTRGLTISPGKMVRTMLDDMVEDAQGKQLFADVCFSTRNGNDIIIGTYSQKEKKINVYRYFEK